MKKLILAATIVAASTTASAYEAGTFTCPGKGQLPPNIYVLKKIAVGGEILPYLEMTRHFVGAGGGQVDTATLKGFAIEARHREKITLTLAAVSLELIEGKLGDCSFVPVNPAP